MNKFILIRSQGISLNTEILIPWQIKEINPNLSLAEIYIVISKFG
jgi:hypothetical protein